MVEFSIIHNWIINQPCARGTFAQKRAKVRTISTINKDVSAELVKNDQQPANPATTGAEGGNIGNKITIEVATNIMDKEIEKGETRTVAGEK